MTDFPPDLIQALRTLRLQDLARFESMRNELLELIDRHPDRAEQKLRGLPDEERALLVAWLAARAPFAPAMEDTATAERRERLYQEVAAMAAARCDALFEDWRVDRIAALMSRAEGALTVARVTSREAWRRLALAAFGAEAFTPVRRLPPEDRFAVCEGFASGIEGLLLHQSGREQSLVLAYGDRVALVAGGRSFTTDDVAEHIRLRSGIERAAAGAAADAIAVSLPAHQTVLDGILVQLEGTGCRLSSAGEDLLDDEQATERAQTPEPGTVHPLRRRNAAAAQNDQRNDQLRMN